MALVPPAVVTVTSTVPVPADEVAVIWVALLTLKKPAALPPNLTAVAPVKLVPVIVTLVPPRRTGIRTDVSDRRRRHKGELIGGAGGAAAARRGHRYVNGASSSSRRARGDLG